MTAIALFIAALALPAAAEPKTVASVDLDRYAGRWFEIARFPNRFQRDCTSDVVALYTVRSDGRLAVENRCRKADGSTKDAKGVARVTDASSKSKLEVRFAPGWLSFIPSVWGDYWILALDADYRLALVGSPDREYLWLLGREASPPEADVTRMIEIARQQGFEVDRLERTTHSNEAPQAQ